MLRKLSGYLRQERILKSGIVFTAHTYRSREDNCAEKLVAVSSPVGHRLDCGAQTTLAQSFILETGSRGGYRGQLTSSVLFSTNVYNCFKNTFEFSAYFKFLYSFEFYILSWKDAM